MVNYSKCYKILSILKNAPEATKCYSTNLFNRQLMKMKTYESKYCQVRYKNTSGPDTPLTFQRQRMPYANKDLEKVRGNLLMCIPLMTFGLGTWQVKRLKWKTELIQNLNERLAQDPVPLPLDKDPDDIGEYTKVIVKGTFDHSKEVFLGPKPCYVNGEIDRNVVSKTGEGSYGYLLITPLVLSGSGERILVNRGWIRTRDMKPEKRPWSRVEGEQTIVGLVRKSETPSSFGAEGIPKHKIYHYRVIENMAKKAKCKPIYIDAVADHSIPNQLWAGQTNVKVRNEHMSYIITWYALSAVTGYMWYARYVAKRL